MANYGRKGKGTAGSTDSTPNTVEEQLKLVQKQLLVLQNANEELAQKLQDALINQATAAGGGSVAIMPPMESGSRVLDVPSDPDVTGGTPPDTADFGKVWLVRVYSDKAPPQTKIPCVVQVAKPAKNGKIAFFRRKFYTDTPIELPEKAIKTLETPEEREFFEETGSEVYEAALRGDMGPAKEACAKMGLEQVVWQGERLKYVGYIYHYTISRIAEREGHLFVPVSKRK